MSSGTCLEKWEGVECLLFKDTEKDLEVAAWVNRETLLPVFFRKGASTWSYRYFSSPATLLTDPEDVAKSIQIKKQWNEEISRKPARS